MLLSAELAKRSVIVVQLPARQGGRHEAFFIRAAGCAE
jgi:hypothetical protein